MDRKVIIFSAPSGAGKSTIVGHLLQKFPFLEFSVSATSRSPRGREQNGKEYYFYTKEEFEDKIRRGEFVEYEQVYEGMYYGTLRSEVERIWNKGCNRIRYRCQGRRKLKAIVRRPCPLPVYPAAVRGSIARTVDMPGYRPAGSNRKKMPQGGGRIDLCR